MYSFIYLTLFLVDIESQTHSLSHVETCTSRA